jgi:penicillin V acylase-like amidase (Ntn superfamily)
MKRAVPAVLLAAVLTSALPAPACTTFCLRRGADAVFGKNYDWSFGDGLVLVNKRGVAKKADLPPREKPASWVSRYGSLTFNQYGREFPSGGMNEAGLAIELMWLDDTRYPDPDGKPAVNCLEWIQYNLDRFATVAEVTKHAGELRISADAKIHFLVCDKGGSCASVEFLGGRPAIHAGARTLANNTYEESLRYRESRGGEAAQGTGSLARFARAAGRVDEFGKGKPGGADPVRYAFDTLDAVAQPGYTQWSIVYDLKAGKVHWRTRENRAVRSVALSAFDLSCGKPVQMLGIQAGPGGDAASLFTP